VARHRGRRLVPVGRRREPTSSSTSTCSRRPSPRGRTVTASTRRRYMWETLFGSRSWTNPGDDKIKLWYAHYDKVRRLLDVPDVLVVAHQVLALRQAVRRQRQHVQLQRRPQRRPRVLRHHQHRHRPRRRRPSPRASLAASLASAPPPVTAPEPKQWVSSSAGATGCELLPNEVRCCVANSANAPATPCSFSGATGQCVATATCICRRQAERAERQRRRRLARSCPPTCAAASTRSKPTIRRRQPPAVPQAQRRRRRNRAVCRRQRPCSSSSRRSRKSASRRRAHWQWWLTAKTKSSTPVEPIR
jgi:hypothetical protein